MHHHDRCDAMRRNGPSQGRRLLFLLLASWAVAACRPGETWAAPGDDSLGGLVLVVHGNSAGRQLEVLLERLEPNGCLEGSPGCDWIQKAPLLLDLVASQVDETWSGTLEKVEVGNYRLEASASAEGSTFGTASKVPVEIRRGNQPQLHLLLRQQVGMPPHHVPYFDSLLLDVHPVEPGGTVQITIGAGPSTANLQLWARSEDPVPQGASTCPGGGCNRGAFTGTFPRSLNPALGATLPWQAPADPGDFDHPIELEIHDARNATAKIRFSIQVETACTAECDGVCVDLQSDPLHCGACDATCPAIANNVTSPYCGAAKCNGFVQIVGSFEDTCALTSAGKIACWGRNQNGFLGVGSTAQQNRPAIVRNVDDAVHIGMGGDIGGTQSTAGPHVCAIRSSGQVQCWGRNAYGQLGNNSTDGRTTPVNVSNLTQGTVTHLALGDNHSCALLTDRSVRCWGRNNEGQLGDASTSERRFATPVSGISTATQISAGGLHTCALLADHSVKCWGSNGSGQIGNQGGTQSTTPVSVALGGNAIHVSAGTNHSCAVLENGSAYCWGDGSSAKLGNGSSTSSSTPVAVIGLTGAAKIKAGMMHSCALKVNGQIWCWGFNIFGQLGDNQASGTMPTQIVQVTAGSPALDFDGGKMHSCFLNEPHGQLKCWGINTYGTIGDGTSAVHRLLPTAIQW